MRIALIGYGKMGHVIEQVAIQRKHEITLKINIENISDLSEENLSKADVAIEFTQPDAAYRNVLKCFESGLPVVCGTTGWNEKVEEVKKLCKEKNQSFFYSSNYSIGVNMFFEINRNLAAMINKFEQYNQIWITEVHHTEKKDTPSGTAITIAEEMMRNIKRLREWKNYHADHLMEDAEESDHGILAINSIRMGEVAGIHEVNYESEEDNIHMVHQAKNRTGFARGAVMAAEYLAGKKGVFGMKDLLGL
jgi:4-hydroxy-tetrahydrodipicolinate reductase